MRAWAAALYKDVRLFLSGAGLLALLLPVLLFPALKLGMDDLSQLSYVRPFPVAVRDLDDTLMSRSLISQIEQVRLFSRVDRLQADTPDSEALEAGAAAVVTIPKDFFYRLYRMEDCPVEVVLNEDMALEASLFRAVIQSVMGIIQSDQAAQLGVYTLVYGDLTAELEETLYLSAGQQLFQDALGRQLVFDGPAEAADLAGAMGRRLLACVLGILTILLALSAAKTLPEEFSLGVLPRFQAAGGSRWAFLGAKFLTTLLVHLPVLLLLGILSGVDWPGLLALDLCLLFAAFGLMTALAAWTGASAQRWGNLFLLISLVLGGTLWPRTVLPGILPLLGKLTLPFYALLGLEGLAQGLDFGSIALLLWPLPVMGILGLAVAVPGFHRHSRTSSKMPRQAETASPSEAPARGFFRRLTALSSFKLRAMSGGYRGLAAILAVAVLCGAAAVSVKTARPNTLELLVCDLDNSPASQQLISRMTGTDGVRIVLCDETSGEKMLLAGESEGLLVIGQGYGPALEADDTLPLHYQGTSSAQSVQGAREIIAGAVAAQRARLRANLQAAELLGRSLTGAEQAELSAEIGAAEAAMPPLYQITSQNGGFSEQPFVPSPLGFGAFAALFTCLTAGSWCCSRDSRLIQRRMSGMFRGPLLAYGSDFLALTVLALLALLAVLLPGGTVPGPTVLLYALCMAALSLALARFTVLEGRVDTLAPCLALVLCLLGGCFMDASLLPKNLALMTPPGALMQTQGGPICLALQTVLFTAIGFPWRRNP